MAATLCPRRSAITRRPISYKQLNDGLPVEREKLKRKTWSTTKFYPLEIIDSKTLEEKLYVKVHYTEPEWNSSLYDEWRLASEVIDIPECHISYTDELKDVFFSKLKIAIKESLHAQRKVDSLVNIEIDIQRDLFFDVFPHPEHFSRKQHVQFLANWDTFLGPNWNIRVVNCKGDHAFVTPGTLVFWMRERRPLEEYAADGTLTFLHRGFKFHVQFVRGLGNRFDLENIQS